MKIFVAGSLNRVDVESATVWLSPCARKSDKVSFQNFIYSITALSPSTTLKLEVNSPTVACTFMMIGCLALIYAFICSLVSVCH